MTLSIISLALGSFALGLNVANLLWYLSLRGRNK